MKKENDCVRLFFIVLIYRLVVLSVLVLASKQPLTGLAQWFDGAAYMRIAESFPLPYHEPSMIADTKTYPLFPLMIFLFNLVLRNIVLSSYLVVTLASTLAVVVFYKIASKFSDHAFSLAILFSCFSPNWVHCSTFLYAEPIFMLFLLLAVWFFLEEKFLKTRGVPKNAALEQ